MHGRRRSVGWSEGRTGRPRGTRLIFRVGRCRLSAQITKGSVGAIWVVGMEEWLLRGRRALAECRAQAARARRCHSRSRRGTQASVSAELARFHSQMSLSSPSAVCVFLSAVYRSLRLRPPGQHITHHTTAPTAHRNRPPYQTSQPCADALLRPKSKEEQKGEPSDLHCPHLDN